MRKGAPAFRRSSWAEGRVNPQLIGVDANVAWPEGQKAPASDHLQKPVWQRYQTRLNPLNKQMQARQSPGLCAQSHGGL